MNAFINKKRMNAITFRKHNSQICLYKINIKHKTSECVFKNMNNNRNSKIK